MKKISPEPPSPPTTLRSTDTREGFLRIRAEALIAKLPVLQSLRYHLRINVEKAMTTITGNRKNTQDSKLPFVNSHYVKSKISPKLSLTEQYIFRFIILSLAVLSNGDAELFLQAGNTILKLADSSNFTCTRFHENRVC